MLWLFVPIVGSCKRLWPTQTLTVIYQVLFLIKPKGGSEKSVGEQVWKPKKPRIKEGEKHWPGTLLFPRSSASHLTLKHNFERRKGKKGRKEKSEKWQRWRGRVLKRVQRRGKACKSQQFWIMQPKTSNTNCSWARQANPAVKSRFSYNKSFIKGCYMFRLLWWPLIIKQIQVNK